MVLSVVTINAITPRGGPIGTTATITGSGFGVIAGTVIFDPLGLAIPATIVSWVDAAVVFTVPAGALSAFSAEFAEVQLLKAGNTDGGTFRWWFPATAPGVDGLDYQYPFFEAGALENTDDPTKIEARDFNRLLDRVKSEVVVLALGDKNKHVASATTGNGANTGLTVTGAPRAGSFLQVFVNGYMAFVSNAVGAGDCFFSRDGGVTAVAEGSIQTGDTLFWNGVIATFNLATIDRIDFVYLS